MAEINVIFEDPQPRRTFEELAIGDIFMTEASNTIYMVTNSPECIDFNAIRLWDGYHVVFENKEKVFKYAGKLIFNRNDFI